MVSAVLSPLMPIPHVAMRDAHRRWRTASGIRRAVILFAVVAMATGASPLSAELALAANGSQPGGLSFSPVHGPTTLKPTWSTTQGCPPGYQGSAEMSEFNRNGTLASRISPVVNGGVTTAFRGTLDGNIGAVLRVTDITKGGTVKFAVGCYSLIGGTGSVKFVFSALLTLSPAGTSYTTKSLATGQQAPAYGTGAGASAASASGTGGQVAAAWVAGACALGLAVAGTAWYRRRNRSQLM
jgi:hypothetical protein